MYGVRNEAILKLDFLTVFGNDTDDVKDDKYDN